MLLALRLLLCDDDLTVPDKDLCWMAEVLLIKCFLGSVSEVCWSFI